MIKVVYELLLALYGKQGWWPFLQQDELGAWQEIYHLGDYSFPVSKNEVFEVAVGTILTQNSSWANAAKALINLKESGHLNPNAIIRESEMRLKEEIYPARYYNQKYKYILSLAQFFNSSTSDVNPTREQLLQLKGVGNETADAMLLYGFHQPEFVVDAYTRRMFSHLGLIALDLGYIDVKHKFENSLGKNVNFYKEYHALIVEHGKSYYSRKPYGEGDPLLGLLKNKRG